jgi:hypothetical protein
VADKRRDDGKEPLTEREREDLQELARQIVREAGLVPDPEGEAEEKRKEYLEEAVQLNGQAQREFYKHMTTLGGASILAAVAVYGAFLKDVKFAWLFYSSLWLIVVGMIFAGMLFGMSSTFVGFAAMRGRFRRDRTLDELVKKTRFAFSLQVFHVLLVMSLWLLGFLGVSWFFTVNLILRT